MNRRQFIAAASSATTFALASFAEAQPATEPSSQPTTAPATKPSPLPPDLVWHDVRDIGVQGRAFHDTESYFDRLSGRAKGVVRDELWNLSRHTAGFSTQFQTDATSIFVRYELLNELLAMAHMPATGVSGVDLYTRSDTGWNYLATHLPRSKSIETRLISDLTPGFREYRLHLPLYNGVTAMQIGLPKESAFGPIAPRRDKPILFYGTSITQGGCASRPGLAFTNILSRRLDRTILNFGFSGNGRMELEVARFLIELDPSLFVIDCLANLSPKLVAERTGPLVKLIREAHANTPILLLDERTVSNAAFNSQLGPAHEQKSKALLDAFNELRQSGVTNLHHRGGADLLGSDSEGTVDTSHPNDLGMMRYADALEPDLKKLLA